MIHASPSTQAVFQNDIDAFGDSFTADTTVENLRELFKEMAKKDKETDTNVYRNLFQQMKLLITLSRMIQNPH